MTFSIVARSTDGESWGVAVASKFLAVGAVVPAAVAQVGAIATQADANVAFKGLALSHLDDGATASVALQRLLEEDDGRDERQVGIVDAEGGSATHTGHACLDWAGGVIGSGYAIQGNILAGEFVVAAMQDAFEASDGEEPLARRLLAALSAGDDAGGDRRGRQSAALLVVRDGAGYGGGDDIAADLRVDDHADPVTELARLLDLNDLYLTASTETERVDITDGAPGRDRAPRARARLRRPQLLGRHGELRDARGPERRVDRREGPRDPPRHARRPEPDRMSVLAIDAGTTGVTAVVVTPDGRIAAKGYQEFAQHFPHPGWVEHAPEEIWQATIEATRAVLASYDGSQLQAVGITNQRETVLLWDRETLGSPRRAIVWQDRRTAAICDPPARRGPRGARHRADRAAARPLLLGHQADLALRARATHLGARRVRPVRRRHGRLLPRRPDDPRHLARHRRVQRVADPAHGPVDRRVVRRAVRPLRRTPRRPARAGAELG